MTMALGFRRTVMLLVCSIFIFSRSIVLYAGGPAPSPECSRLLTLVNLGLQQMTAERQDLSTALNWCGLSPSPMNPFLGLRSYFGQALAQRAEGCLQYLQEEDWHWFRGRIRSLSESIREQSSLIQVNAARTSLISSIRFLSHKELTASLQRPWRSKFDVVAREYVGTADGFHVVRVSVSSGESGHLGLVSIAESSDFESAGKRVNLHSTPTVFRSEDESIPRINPDKAWVLDGKLYAALFDPRRRADSLVQLDPFNGSVIKKFEDPEDGSMQIWKLKDSQILAVSWGRFLSLIGPSRARQFYRFDTNAGTFVKTGLNIGFLNVRTLDMEATQDSTVLQINRRVWPKRNEKTIHTDGVSLFVSTGATKEHFSGGSGFSESVGWSDVQSAMVSIDNADHEARVLTLNIIDKYIQTTGEQNRTKKVSPNSKARSVELSIPDFKSTLGPDQVKILRVDDTTLNIVYLLDPFSPDHIWLVDRNSLEVVAMDVPIGQHQLVDLMAIQRKSRSGSSWEFRRINSRSGHHILAWRDRLQGVHYVWTLNPVSLKFEGPEVFQYPVSGSTAPAVYGSKSEALVGQLTENGIWLRQTSKIQREESP